MGISRRKFLGWMGAGAGALTGTKALAASGKSFPGYPGSMGVLHDATRCIGCRKCEQACNAVNEQPAPERPFDDLTVMDTWRRTGQDTYTVVNRYTPKAGGKPVFVKTQCNHCLEPACASACFVQAFKKQKNGAVTYNEDVCVGCRYCMIACPFYVPAYTYDSALSPKVTKCTLCAPRLEQGLLPGCVEACPKEALVYGPRDKLIEFARERIRKHPGQYVDHIYGEREMGGTSWLYLSGAPFSEIKMREDLGEQAAGHYTKGALAAVPVVVGLWPVLLTGIWAISKRRDRVAEQEKEEAVSQTRTEMEQQMRDKLDKQKADLEKKKEAAIKKEVKKALEEAEKKAREDLAGEDG